MNGPRVAGKLLTSVRIANATGENVNASLPEVCKMAFDSLSSYGADALLEVKAENGIED